VTDQNPKKPHLSKSQIDLYHKCPEAYRRRYIEGEKRPPGIALLVGTGVHVGAETNFRQKIETHQDLSADDIIDASVAGFEQRCSVEGYELTNDEAGRGAKLVLGIAKDIVVDLAGLYADEMAPDYQPTEVEKSTVIELPNCSHDLVSITDLRDDRDRVVDFKTAARKPSESEAATSIQLTINAAAFAVDTGRAASEVRLDVLTKTKTPARHVLKSERDADDFQMLAHRIDAMAQAINAGVFPPAPLGSWQCSARHCGFWSTCHYSSKRSS
jgi:CRISPR/Cas system-associated exonuclease Cas4 (RecB family)